MHEIAKEKLNLALHCAGMVVIAGGAPGARFKSPELCRLLGIEDESADLDVDVIATRVHPEDRQAFLTHIERARSYNGKSEHEYRVLLPSGEVRWLASKGAFLQEGSGESSTRYRVIQDITKLKQSEDQIRRKNHDLSVLNEKLHRFSSMVAHDLQGPLTSILMVAEIIERAESLDEVDRSAKFIKLAVARMANFITDLLEFAKTENEGGLQKEAVSLEETIEIVKSNLKAAIAENHAQIEIQSPLPKVLGSPTQLLQLFQNLISNSLKFRSSQTPQVTVNVKENSDHWLVTIRDNGEGMDAKKSQNIFEPFQRLHSEKMDGTGLGLSICKRIVELHGGKIWVESQLGLGSAFSFTLSTD